MGEWYELRWLAGKPYIDYQSEASKWDSACVDLSMDELQRLEDFQVKQSAQEKEFIKSLIAHKQQVN